MRQHRRAGLHQGCREQGREHGTASCWFHKRASTVLLGLAGKLVLVALTNGAVAEVHSISLQHAWGNRSCRRLVAPGTSNLPGALCGSNTWRQCCKPEGLSPQCLVRQNSTLNPP